MSFVALIPARLKSTRLPDKPLADIHGKPMIVLGSIMDELSEDMAKGEGEALTTYAVVLGVKPEDRAHFAEVTHEHFAQIFTKSDVTAADVLANTQAVLKQDARLAKYATPT